MVKRWIHWISLINRRFKLNFDGSRIENKSALGWFIKYSNGTITMVASRNIDNASIIIAECMTLRDEVLVAKNHEFLNLDVEGYLKIVIDYYNKNNNISNSIMLLIEDIWKL